MKKILLVSISIITVSLAANAQKGWAIGDRAMIGHSWTVGNSPDKAKYKFHPSFQLGRQAVYNFSDNTGIGFGTYFSSEGVSFDLDNTDAVTRSRANYIRIPVFASFTFGDAYKKMRPRLTVGPSVGFLVGGKSLVENDDRFIGIRTTKSMDTKIDAGINTSLGLSYKIAEGVMLNHDINYYHGLVEQKPNTGAVPGAASFTQRSLGISMGMLITGNAMKYWKHKNSCKK